MNYNNATLVQDWFTSLVDTIWNNRKKLSVFSIHLQCLVHSFLWFYLSTLVDYKRTWLINLEDAHNKRRVVMSYLYCSFSYKSGDFVTSKQISSVLESLSKNNFFEWTSIQMVKLHILIIFLPSAPWGQNVQVQIFKYLTDGRR